MRKKGSLPSCAQRLTVLGTHEEVRRPARCAGAWAGLAGATCAPVLAVVPRWRGRPYACRVRCHRGFYPRLATFGCIPVRLGSRPVSFMDVDQSVVAVAGP